MSVDHPYAFGIYSVINDVIFYENIKNNIKEIKNIDIIFSTPSFFINFIDFIEINKNQKIIFTGEEIPVSLKKYLNEIGADVYQSFGMSECLNIGIKKMNDDFYSFIDENITIKDNHIYSPYLCSYIIENDTLREVEKKYRLSDAITLKDGAFSFLERNSEIAKINENKISLKMISNFLFSIKKINDLVIFKSKKNDLDEINLFYVSDLNEKEIENKILENFNNYDYVPKNIYKVEKIPITDLGKKDILKLKDEYKI